jgi:hypothetical protein
MNRFELDPRWSDTGDRYVSFLFLLHHRLPGHFDPEQRLMARYILKLFRDFVFHSIGVDNTPILDLSHVLTCLNKVRHTSLITQKANGSLTPGWMRKSCWSPETINRVW